MATNPRQGEREASDLSQETRKTTEQAGQTARTISDAAERTSRLGTEAFQRNTEKAKESLQEGTETTSRTTQRSMAQFSKMFGIGGDSARETLQQTAGNLQALMAGTTVIASGVQEVTGEWMRFAQERVENNIDHLDRLGQCRNVHDCLALQTQILRDNLQALLESTQRTSERSTQIARTAADRMTNPQVPR